MRARENLIGVWAYTAGVILAVIIGIVVGFRLDVPNYNILSVWITLILLALGITIGFLNESTVYNNQFLTAGVVLVLVSYFGVGAIENGILLIGFVGKTIISIFNSLLLLFVPATIVVALKTLFSLNRV
ncbi:MAG: hypothetical protein AABY22_03700 [Nanoarchaeota archaeon]